MVALTSIVQSGLDLVTQVRARRKEYLDPVLATFQGFPERFAYEVGATVYALSPQKETARPSPRTYVSEETHEPRIRDNYCPRH